MKPRIDEYDEFLLSRLLDGELPADQAVTLHRRMEREPELRAAFESLARVDALLARRQADQPAVHWRQFHEKVLAAVAAQAAPAPKTIPLARWLGICAPLAAAAAIGLIVLLDRDRLQVPKDGAIPTPIRVTVNSPAEDAPGKLTVRLYRPRLNESGDTGVLRVAFSRSPQLAEAIRRQDQASQSRPTSVVVAARHRPSPPQLELLVDLLPL